jgi:hypothetical protein
MTKQLYLPWHYPDEWVAAQKRKKLDHRHVSTLISTADGDVDAFRPDGTQLIAFRPRAIPPEVCRWALPAAVKVAKWSPHREAHSNIAGSFDIPFPRLTEFTRKHHEDWLRLLPLLRLKDEVYEAACPDHYALQAEAGAVTHPYWMIPDTVSTTLTANNDWESRVHLDKGNLPGGMSVLTILSGPSPLLPPAMRGLLVLPKWGVGIDVGVGDVLIADLAAEWHGNTAIAATSGWGILSAGYVSRVSTVMYFRAGLRGAVPLGCHRWTEGTVRVRRVLNRECRQIRGRFVRLLQYDWREVPAHLLGPLAIHRNYSYQQYWTVTGVRSGLAICSELFSKEDARQVAEHLYRRCGAAFSFAQRDLIVSHVPPAVWPWVKACDRCGRFLEPPAEESDTTNP